MRPVTIRIAREMEAIPMLQAAAAFFVRNAGLGEEAVWQTELVLEEVVSNVIRYGLQADPEASVEATFSMEEDILKVRLRFRGIRLDVDSIRRWEQMELAEILDQGGQGVGLRLIRRFCTDVQYRNLGRDGQEIVLRRAVVKPASTPSSTSDAGPGKGLHTALQSIRIRRMRPEEAAAVSRLAYFSYRYTYFNEVLYLPEEIRKRNEDGRFISHVALDENGKTIIGHLAEVPDPLSGMPELAAVFVDPDYRRKGCMNALVADRVQGLQDGRGEGVFSTAGTSHPYSQMSLHRFGLRGSALLVSRLTPVAFQGIMNQAVARESVFYMVRVFDPKPRRPYYAPPRHRDMIQKICKHVGMAVTFADIPGSVPLSYGGEIEQFADPYGAGHITVQGWGDDTIVKVRAILRAFCLDRLETIYLYLPLSEPATAVCCPEIEGRGFFFAGVKPGRGGRDWLILQYLNNQRYDYGRTRTAPPSEANSWPTCRPATRTHH